MVFTKLTVITSRSHSRRKCWVVANFGGKSNCFYVTYVNKLTRFIYSQVRVTSVVEVFPINFLASSEDPQLGIPYMYMQYLIIIFGPFTQESSIPEKVTTFLYS
ncbi:unnamed protein product [Amoebophrya sp. A25]|nr:unnamed protein product [Amoebophrya sp. A25]|eukprot:GSA25T00004917001.1